MRILIFGSHGMLGRDMVALAPRPAELLTPLSREVDLADADAVGRAIVAHAPDAVVNAAAYTQVDRAETDLDLARAVNVGGPRAIGEACAVRGIPVVHFSTDYVFPGSSSRPYREEDPVDPVNAYGRTKLDGERALLDSGARALVIRTSWLFGLHRRSFPRTMWERARDDRPTRVVDDQHGRPTSTRDLARAAWRLLEEGATGILHASNEGPATTWYGVAREVFELAGAPRLLSPCSSADYPTPAQRPAYSVLDTTRLAALLGAGLPPWRDALHEFLRALEREGAAAAR